jgi:hypothetical protein
MTRRRLGANTIARYRSHPVARCHRARTHAQGRSPLCHDTVEQNRIGVDEALDGLLVVASNASSSPASTALGPPPADPSP